MTPQNFTYAIGDKVRVRASWVDKARLSADTIWTVSETDAIPVNDRVDCFHHQWVYFAERGGKRIGMAISGALIELAEFDGELFEYALQMALYYKPEVTRDQVRETLRQTQHYAPGDEALVQITAALRPLLPDQVMTTTPGELPLPAAAENWIDDFVLSLEEVVHGSTNLVEGGECDR